MKTLVGAASAVALLATMSLATAQSPRGGGDGQKEMSSPSAKDATPADKDMSKGRERKETTTDQKDAQDKGTKNGSKDTGKKEASDKDKSDNGKSAAEKDRSADKEKAAADKNKSTSDKTRSASDKDKGKQAAGKNGKGSSGAVSLSQEQRTKVQGSFAKHKRQSANVNITVNVGVAVPRSVELYAIPQDVVVIAPAYRRYRYFVVDNRICIVDPATYEIVDIIIIA